MESLAEHLDGSLETMRLGKGRHEVQLWLRDGSYLHFRHDRHTRWVQAGRNGESGLAAALAAAIDRFELKGRRLLVFFEDESWLELRLGAFGTLRRSSA